MSTISIQTILSLLTAIVMAITLPAVLWYIGGAWQWVVYGAVAWVGGVALKIPVSAALVSFVPQSHAVARATCLGLVSSSTELGMAIMVLLMAGGSDVMLVVDVSLYALAAGATEVIVLACLSLAIRPDKMLVAKWNEGAATSLCVRYMFLIERTIALAGHTGSRGLVCLALITGAAWPALIAVAGFSATDGLACYGELKCWDWTEPRRCRALFGLLALIAGAELALFILVGLRSGSALLLFP